jgi:hypothetical protein
MVKPMKTKKKDFDIFRKECRRLIDSWELNGWSVRFEHNDIGNREAAMQRDAVSHNATIALNTELEFGSFKEEKKKNEYLKELAKHETIHLLLGRLSYCGEYRWVTDSEYNEAEEELVRKLIKII